MNDQDPAGRAGPAEEPPNNPLKMFMQVPAFLIGIMFVILGTTGLGWWAIVVGLTVVVTTGASLYVTAKGRNPRWNQAAFDRPGDPSKAAITDAWRPRRARDGPHR